MRAEQAQVSEPQPSRRASEMPRQTRSDFSVGPGVQLLQLSHNESAFRLPAAWLEAANRAATAGTAYPDPECMALRQAIAETLGLDDRRIFCSAGLLECLQTLALAYLDPDDEVIIPEHAFPFFRQVARLAGAVVKIVPERDLRVDTASILQAVGPSTKMVIFANPGNPTGSYLCKDCIARLHALLPPAILLVIDEAYAEFVDDGKYQPLFDLTDAGNVTVLRSFSKMYGLAGLRVGWAYCPPSVTDYLRRIQVPAIVSSCAASMASVAIRDQVAVRSFKHEMIAVRQRFIGRLAKLHRISSIESEANFVLLRTRSETEAQHLDRFLRQRGIVLRRPMAVGLEDCIRATIGTEEQMQFVASAIAEWCGGQA